MKQIKLLKIKYHNFKGLRDFELEPNGQNISVLGQNATGKTTLFDGFMWLLFGKNSDEIKKFEVKPLDDKGNEMLGLEPRVEATLEIDDKPLTLKRELLEVWSKPKGKLDAERKPDKTSLYIDEVPKKVNEFNTFIDSIIDDDNFKLLTNPFAFNNLHWTKRREILTGLIQDVSDDDVIKNNPKLSDLTKILGDHSVDDQREIIQSQKKKIKQDINGIPARVDEATRAIPETSSTSEDVLKEIYQEYEKSFRDAQSLVNATRHSSVDDDLKQKRRQIVAEQTDARSKFIQTKQLSLSTLMNDVTDQQQVVNRLTQQRFELDTKTHQLKTEIDELGNKRESLLSDYHQETETTFDDHQLTCPTCSQDLPANQVDKLREQFNTKHSALLDDLLVRGKATAADLKTAAAQLNDTETQFNAADKALRTAKVRLDEINSELNFQKSQQGQFEDSADAKLFQQRLDEIDQQIAAGSQGVSASVVAAEEKANSIKREMDKAQSELAKFDQVRNQQKRIEELKQDEIKMKQKFQELERQSWLLDEFTRTKVQLMEKEINDKFKLVSFKLFRNLKSGDLEEICETLVGGVPFSTDLNNAARINGGLDIINTLSEFYGISAPIFIDNAESVNSVAMTDSQQIALVVSTDKKMKVVA